MPLLDTESLTPESHLLLDTGVWIAAAAGEHAALHPALPPIIERAAHAQRLWISPLSALEVTIAVRNGEIRLPNVDAWFADQQRPPGVRLLEVDISTASGVASLPAPSNGEIPPTKAKTGRGSRKTASEDSDIWAHPNMVDRFIAAHAWKKSVILLTLDQVLVDYGENGPINVVDARAVS